MSCADGLPATAVPATPPYTMQKCCETCVEQISRFSASCKNDTRARSSSIVCNSRPRSCAAHSLSAGCSTTFARRVPTAGGMAACTRRCRAATTLPRPWTTCCAGPSLTPFLYNGRICLSNNAGDRHIAADFHENTGPAAPRPLIRAAGVRLPFLPPHSPDPKRTHWRTQVHGRPKTIWAATSAARSLPSPAGSGRRSRRGTRLPPRRSRADCWLGCDS
jgi:hypothetical protein